MIKKLAILLIAFVLLFETSASYAYTVTADFSKYRGVNAAARSLLMPGWGQGWNEQYTKGWIVFGLFAISVFGSFYYYNKSESDYKKYQNEGAIYGSRYNDYEDSYNISRTCGIVAITVWAYAVIDAFFVGQNKSKLYVGNNRKFDIVAHNDDGFMLKYKTKFSL